MSQLTLDFSAPAAAVKLSPKDAGIKAAVDHANAEIIHWSKMAYDFLVKFAMKHEEFMAENVREASKGTVPEPPHKRAWGGIMLKGKKTGIITQVDVGQVKNKTAHGANAGIWKSNLNCQ